MLDSHHVRTGFRTVACTPEGLFINNRKIKIMGLEYPVPFMITEFSGTAFPTKLCYHGVMDMLRIPKYAVHVLRSQKNPEQEIGVWRDLWQDGKITGYYKGKAVIQKRFLRDSSLHDMEVTADDAKLYGDYTDTTRVVCRVTDRVSTTLVCFPGIIQVETKGPVQVIGPTAIPVRGGYAAVWIKANPQDFSGDTETAEIHIRLADTPVERKCVKIDVVKSDIVMG